VMATVSVGAPRKGNLRSIRRAQGTNGYDWSRANTVDLDTDNRRLFMVCLGKRLPRLTLARHNFSRSERGRLDGIVLFFASDRWVLPQTT
jgi:hypothetical protein